MDSDNINCLFNAFRTSLEMMEDRGYFVPSDLKNITTESFKENYENFNTGNGLVYLFNHCENDSKTIVYFVKNTSSISTQDISNFTKKLQDNLVKNGIIVSNKNLAANSEKIMKEINLESEYRVEYFNIDELLVNIAKHELVPKHIIVSEEEKRMVLKKYRVKPSQLPKILVTDPMARYLGVKKGMLIKIIRNSQTSGLHVVYRIVI
jgi:DNA-directed RNA polymerase I, II, and III subunit RPABC1